MGLLDKLFGKDRTRTKRNGYWSKDYFYDIMRSEFPEITVEEDISAPDLGWYIEQTAVNTQGDYPCRKFDYVLYLDGRLVAIVMETIHNTGYRAEFINAKDTALRYGVPFVNFFTHFPNEREYVINRIRNVLN